MKRSMGRVTGTAWLLWLLLALFILRVVGQMAVQIWEPHWLPISEEWYSGVVPYGRLLIIQFALIVIHGLACWQMSWKKGWFFLPKRWLGRLFVSWGTVYLIVMVTRYIVRMSLYPPERWMGGAIPILFHCVLAAFVLVLGVHHLRHTAKAVTVRPGWKRQFAKYAVWSLGGLASFAVYLAWLAYTLAPNFLGREIGTTGARFAVRVETDVRLTTPDGTILSANVFHPVRAGDRTPTILVRIPYSKTWKNTLFTSLVGQMWAEQGYTVVIQGTRGRYLSTGTYEPFVHEAADGAATLAWLKEQPWYNGRIGTWGGSYFGYTQWTMSASRDPALSAMIIQEASTDFHGMFHPGGAFSLESALYWALMSDGPQDVSPDYADLDRGTVGRPLNQADDRAGRDISFFNKWAGHSERDEYWAQVDGNERAAEVHMPVLLMAGWYDPFLPTQLADYESIQRTAAPEVAAECRLIIGPWIHADVIQPPDGFVSRNYRLESLEPSIAWFERHLKPAVQDSTRRVESEPPVRLFVMGQNVWRNEYEWPLARTRHVPWYLQSDGKANSISGDGRLSPEPPANNQPPDRYVFDPDHPVPSKGGAMLGWRAGVALQNDVENRADVLVYTSPPLHEAMEITGTASVNLFVTTSAPCTDFTAKLVDVWPDGSAYNICDGILRQEFSGSETIPVPIEIRLWPTSIVLAKGHRVRLEVSSSNFPRFDANPNTCKPTADETQTQAAQQAIYHLAKHPSSLILPVIPTL